MSSEQLAEKPAGAAGAEGVSAAGAAVELRKVSFSYGARRVLDGVDLTFPRGAVCSVIGPNGCGKSTTVRLICRALVPDAGRVLVDGDDAVRLGRRELARRVAVLGQGSQVPDMPVEQLVMGGRYPHRPLLGGTTPEDRRVVEGAMERAGCARFAGASMASLSGGERQRAYLAMVLAQQARIVLLDEPTTYLDVSACFDLMGLVRELNAEGITVIMVLHDLNLALTSSNYVAVMRAGRVERFGTAAEVAASGVVDEVFDVRLRGVEVDGQCCWCLLPR